MDAVTQLIIHFLTGQIGAYMEFYEFMEDRVLMGVPDYVPSVVIDGSTKVMPPGFFDFSESILNVLKVETGKITLVCLASRGAQYRMHIVTGEAVELRSWEEAGWQPSAPQLAGLEVFLDVPVEDFASEGLS